MHYSLHLNARTYGTELQRAFLTHLSRTSIVFEIWLKCTAECTDKYLWKTNVYFNVISIETCIQKFKYICNYTLVLHTN